MSSQILDAWSAGTTKSISTGDNRVLVVALFIRDDEPASVPAVTSVTYGGQTLTQLAYYVRDGSPAQQAFWVGYLDESGIQSASGTTITCNGTGTPDTIHSATYENVDQTTPNASDTESDSTSSLGAFTASSSITVAADEASFVIGGCKDNWTSVGVTSGYTESLASSGSGGLIVSQTRAAGSSATPTPYQDINGTSNIWFLYGCSLGVASNPTDVNCTAADSVLGGEDATVSNTSTVACTSVQNVLTAQSSTVSNTSTVACTSVDNVLGAETATVTNISTVACTSVENVLTAQAATVTNVSTVACTSVDNIITSDAATVTNVSTVACTSVDNILSAEAATISQSTALTCTVADSVLTAQASTVTNVSTVACTASDSVLNGETATAQVTKIVICSVADSVIETNDATVTNVATVACTVTDSVFISDGATIVAEATATCSTADSVLDGEGATVEGQLTALLRCHSADNVFIGNRAEAIYPNEFVGYIAKRIVRSFTPDITEELIQKRVNAAIEEAQDEISLMAVKFGIPIEAAKTQFEMHARNSITLELIMSLYEDNKTMVGIIREMDSAIEKMENEMEIIKHNVRASLIIGLQNGI